MAPYIPFMAEMKEIVAPDQVGLSARAAEQVRRQAARQNNPKLMLRVSVDGGGCSGFQYSITFDDARLDDDRMVERDGAVMLIDEMSWGYLAGALVDFEDELIGQYFSIKNPNASSTCGCGTSFSLG